MLLSRKPRPLAVVTDGPGPGDRGDPPTLAEQALEHIDALYGLARHLCASPSDAEDIVQETYARALGGMARLTPGSNLRAWLFRVLRNCFIDQARRKKIVLEIADDAVGERSANEVWDVAALDQLRYLAAADLERALATLPIELRFIVLLDAQGFSEAEIAEISRCAPGTVKSRLSRARARLRAALKEPPRSIKEEPR
jgi:RNA polymerase sigma-70 factor (ECF subfamily)